MDTETKQQMEETVNAVEQKLESAIQKYEGQVKDAGSAANEARDEVKKLSEQYADAVKAQDELEQRLKDMEQKAAEGFKGAGAERPQTWGAVLTESDAYKAYKDGQSGKARVEVKNTIMGESGSPQEPSDTLVPQDRQPGIVPGAFRALNVLDFVPTGMTNSNQIEYTRENTWTSSAAETEEGGSKPQSTLTFELVSDPVRTIAHWLKITRQVMDDAPALQSYVDRRLRHGVRKRLQAQVLTGNGNAPNIEGLNQTARHTAFTPQTGETALDSLNRAKYAVIAADYQPDFIFMNPEDWGSIERLKTSDNAYLASNGAALSYINNGMTPLVWGLPVVASNDVTAGKFVLGDSMAMQLFMRQGAVVEMSEADDTNFQQNLVTVRAELRAALAVFTPAAIQYGDLTQ
jgi:HK97 family phage major capsid protein